MNATTRLDAKVAADDRRGRVRRTVGNFRALTPFGTDVPGLPSRSNQAYVYT